MSGGGRHCNETTDRCDTTLVDDGVPCDDGNVCTDGDECEDGLCHDMRTDPLCGTDHYKCYKTRTKDVDLAQPVVSLVDQFAATTARVGRGVRLCNPADKDGEGLYDPTAHLFCYKFRESQFRRRKVTVVNQFGEQCFTVTRPDSLCVPAEKGERDGIPIDQCEVVPSELNINHSKCYKIVSPRGFSPLRVAVADRFETKTTQVVRPRYFCTPVDKNREGIPNPGAHVVCYKVKDVPGQPTFEPRAVKIVDQFIEVASNALQGDCRQSSFLCVPSLVASPSGAFVEASPGLFDWQGRARERLP